MTDKLDTTPETQGVNGAIEPNTTETPTDLGQSAFDKAVAEGVNAKIKQITAEVAGKEKKKLYDEMKGVKQSNQELTTKLAEIHKKEELTRLEKESEALNKLSYEERIAHTIKQNQRILAESNTQMDQIRKSVDDVKQEFTKKLEAKDVELYRQERINSAGGAIIEGLVPSPASNMNLTKLDIDAAVEAARKEYERIADVAQNQRTQSLNNSSTPVSHEVPTTTVPLTAPTTISSDTDIDINNMSDEERYAYKEKLIGEHLAPYS